MADLDEQIDRACADGRIGVRDADELRRFADFLTDAAPRGDETRDQAGARSWRQHYPEDYARALAEKRARVSGDPGDDPAWLVLADQGDRPAEGDQR